MEDRQIQNALEQAVTTISSLQEVIQSLQPMAELGKLVVDDTGLHSWRDAADYLYPRTKIGRNDMLKWLRKIGVVSDTKSEKNVPKIQYIKSGYFELKTGEKNGLMWRQAYVTGKGLSWLMRLWEKYGY